MWEKNPKAAGSSPPEHRYQTCPEPKGSGGGSRDA